MPNWLDGERTDVLRAELLRPSDRHRLGWLSGITAATVTEGYESDTRINASITTVEPESYVDLAMVRLHHTARFSSGEEWSEVIGTFFALRDGATHAHGGQTVTFQLRSALYGMSADLAPLDMTLAKGSQAKAAFERICSDCKRPRLWVDGASDKRFAANRVLEAGQSYLSWLHQLADLAGNRLDVDPQGRVTMSRYVRPRDRAASMRLAWNSPLVLASGIRHTTDAMEVPSRAVVTWEHESEVRVRDGVIRSGADRGKPKYKTKTVRSTVTAYADVTAGSAAHIDRRGFRVATWHAEDDLGDSQALAQKKAAEYLAGEDDPNVTWEVPCRWFEIHEGDVISWLPPGETSYRKCLVHSLERDLGHFTQALTLKEV